MELGFNITIEQTQKLAMTPELVQAIHILQLSNVDLNDYIEREILENPILEEDKSLVSQDVDIRAKIREAGYEESSYKQWEYSPSREDDDYTYEQYTSEVETLTDHLLSQLHLAKNLTDKEYDIAEYIIDAIDDNGYLVVSAEEVCKDEGCSMDEFEDILGFVQTFDPSGVGARSLKECMEIQLAAKGLLTEKIEYIIENHLENLADHKIAVIAKDANMKKEEIQDFLDLLKTLEPKPGRMYSSGDSVKYVVPDIFVEKTDDEYIVTTNDASVSRLFVSSYYDQLAVQAKNDDELKKYLNDRLHAATWLIKSIEQRKRTIFNVASTIVKYQQDFFKKGEKHMKTLTLKQVAEELDIHESTVSRSINGKYLQSPRGVFELKYFFSSGVVAKDGTGVSSSSIKTIIKEIIAEEDQKKPYSDQDMVAILKEKGIKISRRTVAKYREEQGIPSSSKRRRF